MATIIDGKRVAAEVRARVAADAAAVRERTGHAPGLVTVLVGEDPASQVYVRNKIKACEEAGMASFHEPMPATSSQAEVLAMVERCNADDRVDGILVQAPLPAGLDFKQVLEPIDPAQGRRRLPSRSTSAAWSPASPGCGLHAGRGDGAARRRRACSSRARDAVVVGRSDIVGKPVALLLLHRSATVTVCHSRTRDLPRSRRRADVLVAAVGGRA